MGNSTLGRTLHTLAWHALMPLQALALCTGLAGCAMALFGAVGMLVALAAPASAALGTMHAWAATFAGIGCAGMLASLPLAGLGMLCPRQPSPRPQSYQ